jgi:hypothetical protein
MATGGYASGYEPEGYWGNSALSDNTNYSGYDTPVATGIMALPMAARTSSIAAPSKGFIYDPSTHTYVGAGTGDDTMYKGGGQYGLSEAAQKAADEAAAASAPSPSYDGGGGNAQGGLMKSYAFGGMISDLIEKMKAQGAFGDNSGPSDTGTGYTYDPKTKQYSPSMAAGGGISTLGGYSDGGRLLKGPGDGMSDNIPAKIGAKQPARLADGEFVVPADVVSHLGNGSTDAGAKQLYKMMDKIRTARTGRKAQGKQINPNKFMPA